MVSWGWANTISFVCFFYKHTMLVSIRVNCYSFNAHLFASLDDSSCNLSSVGDENAVESLGIRFGSSAKLPVRLDLLEHNLILIYNLQLLEKI